MLELILLLFCVPIALAMLVVVAPIVLIAPFVASAVSFAVPLVFGFFVLFFVLGILLYPLKNPIEKLQFKLDYYTKLSNHYGGLVVTALIWLALAYYLISALIGYLITLPVSILAIIFICLTISLMFLAAVYEQEMVAMIKRLKNYKLNWSTIKSSINAKS